MKSRALPHIAALFTIFIWGFTFISTKLLLEHMGPLQILTGRTALGFIALCLLRPRFLRAKERRHELLFAAAGLTGSFGYFLAENTALEFASASFASVAVSTAPLFTAALGFIILKEKGFGVRFLAGFALAISGIALISFQGGQAYAHPLGILLCLLAALCWAAYSIIVKRLANLGYETIATTKRTFAWGLVFMVLTHVATGQAFPFRELADPAVVGHLAFLGLAASACCFVTWGYTVKHLGATSASAYIYIQPPTTIVWAVLLLGEPFTPAFAIGFVLTVAGLALSEGFDRAIISRFRS